MLLDFVTIVMSSITTL